MPSNTKSLLMAENAALRARLAEREDETANRPSGDGGVLPESEIVESKRIRDALKVSEVRYRRLFETAKDGILILDADTGRITDANPFLRDMLGVFPRRTARQEALGNRPIQGHRRQPGRLQQTAEEEVYPLRQPAAGNQGTGKSMWSSSAMSTG